MDSNLMNVIHGQYRYKPENVSDKYIILYPENDTNDVLMGAGLKDVFVKDANSVSISIEDFKNLSELLKVVIERLNNRAPQTIYKTAYALAVENPVAEVGQLIIEADTKRIKVGDGITKYGDLAYSTTKMDVNPDVDAEAAVIEMKTDDGETVQIAQDEVEAFKDELPDSYTKANIYLKIDEIVEIETDDEDDDSGSFVIDDDNPVDDSGN